MQWNIPGTTLAGNPQEAALLEQQFSAMFLAGGIVLSQVSAITGLEPYMVQNWVKRGFLPSPQQKRYNLNQLCRILNINMLRRVLPMERIVGLLSYINGSLDDSSDDIIDDSKLYFMFAALAARLRTDQAGMEAAIDEAMDGYTSPILGARERVEKVLRIMLTAWAAAQLYEKTEKLLQEL